MIRAEIPQAVAEVFLTPSGGFRASRGKILHGGRGSAKSWSIARLLVIRAYSSRVRILCTREFQSSIKDSVHRLLSDQIYLLGLQHEFDIQRDSIKCRRTGSEFLFKGLRHSIQEIKSTEGIDICWVEEAQSCSLESWQILRPTIRKDGSEIWVSFNPDQDTDPTFGLVKRPPPDWIVRQVNWQDNPFFGGTLEAERAACFAQDPEAYDWIWEGHCRKITDAVIFRNRVSFEAFEEPPNVQPLQGLDFGFANDPNAFVRCFIQDECLYVTHEAFGYQVEIDDLPKMVAGKDGAEAAELESWSRSDDDKWPGVPDAKRWPIKADGARPETISYLSRRGFNVRAAEKWPGSVEDGVAHLKGFKRIVVHERCKHLAQEFRLYSYKTDRVTGETLPVIADKWNHGIDALRYALDGYIMSRGGLGVWAKLARKG